MTEDERIYSAELGARIVLARGKKSQPVFAKELGVNKNTMIGYEKARVAPDILTIRKICALSGVALEWLVNGEGVRKEGNGRVSHLEDPFITEIKLWLNDMTSESPKWRVWFEMEFIDKIPKFKEWLEKKRAADSFQETQAG